MTRINLRCLRCGLSVVVEGHAPQDVLALHPTCRGCGAGQLERAEPEGGRIAWEYLGDRGDVAA